MTTKKKIYVVLRGKKTGFFYDYEDYIKQIKGFSFPISKVFKNEEEALEYYNNCEMEILKKDEEYEKLRQHNEAMKQESKMKFFVVIRGRETGIYNDYKIYKKQIIKFSGAIHRSFKNEKEAKEYYSKKDEIVREKELEEQEIERQREERKKDRKEKTLQKIEKEKEISIENFKKEIKNEEYAFSYTDGSFNEQKRVYGYGGFISYQDKIHFIMGHGCKPKYVNSTSVTGELLGCIKLIEKAIELGIKNLIVFYDYEGIVNFASPTCKKKNGVYEKYYRFINETIKDKINIKFIRVKSHSTDVGNKIVDNLAKCSVGLKKINDDKLKEYNDIALQLVV